LHGFLGLAGYYRRFIKDFGTTAAPLTSLLKRDAFQWTDAAEAAFGALKQALTTAPALALPNFEQPFIVECDASGSGIGAVLHQADDAIAFFSRALPPRHRGLAAYERELIGLSQAVRHWRPYLWGRAFIVRTDHQPLKYILDQRLATIPQHHWVSKLLGFDFSIEYKPGRTNVVADALSRRDEPDPLLHAISSPSFDLLADIKQAATEDEEVRSLRDQITAGTLGAPWTVVDGLVLYQNRIYVPTSSPFLPAILSAVHDDNHEGIQRTLHRLHRDFHVPSARKIVQDFVRACVVCQRNKTELMHPGGLLQPLPVPSAVWQDISMDFVEGLPKIAGKSVILTVVDRFSKYAHFIPLGHPYTAESVARAFFGEIVRLHDIPVSIVSDRDPVFTSAFWRSLFKASGTSLMMSSAFHPQTDGQTEAVNKAIGMYLRCLTAPRSLGLSATSQQYFSLTTNQPPATSQQYFSLRTNQHQPSATNQMNRQQVIGRGNGFGGFPGLSIFIIQLFTQRCRRLPFVWSMAVTHLLFAPMMLVNCVWWPSPRTWPSAMSYCRMSVFVYSRPSRLLSSSMIVAIVQSPLV
jgi:transposase InsO family protein